MIITQPFVSIAWTPLVFWRWRLFCNTSVFRNMWHIHAVFQDKTNNTLRQPSDASTPSPRAPMVRVVSSLTIRIWQCKKAGSMSIPSLFHAPSTFLNSSSALVLAMSLLGSDTERLIAQSHTASRPMRTSPAGGSTAQSCPTPGANFQPRFAQGQNVQASQNYWWLLHTVKRKTS